MSAPPEQSTASRAFDPFEHKPDISDTSRRLYVFNLTKLNDGKPIKDLKFLGKEGIIEKIKDLKPNTRRTYLISIVSALRGRSEPRYQKLYRKFYDELMALNKDLKDNTQKTEKVKDNWIDQKGVMETQKKLAEIVPQIADKKKISEEEFGALLQLVVVSLYTLQSPRRNKDYANMFVVRKAPTLEDAKKNYLDTGAWNWIFNNYKTAKKYAQQVIAVPEPLQDILKLYLKFHPRAKAMKRRGAENEPFLVRYDGTPIDTSPEMTRLLNKIFGKKVGCSMLRSIYLTEKYGDVVKEMKEDVGQMGTSTETAQNNYIKNE
jgi:hypothetical protein